jgi:hypothetical protein
VALAPRADLERRWRVVHTVWLAECAVAVLVWIGLPLILPAGVGQGSFPSFLAPVLFAVAIFDLIIAYWLKHQALAGRLPGGAAAPTAAPGAHLVGPSTAAVALAATPVIFGIITYVLGDGLNALSVFCAMALIGLLFVRPNLEEWEAAAMREAGGDAGRRPRG